MKKGINAIVESVFKVFYNKTIHQYKLWSSGLKLKINFIAIKKRINAIVESVLQGGYNRMIYQNKV